MAKTNAYTTYSYPYLSTDSNHYKNTVFLIDASAGKKDGELFFKITYKINNDAILNLIHERKIKVAAQLRCRVLGLVKIKYFDFDSNTIDIYTNPQDVDEQVELTCFLISNIDFNFDNEDLIDEWKGLNAFILKDNVLGETDSKIITVKHERNCQSIFSFKPVDSMDPNDAPLLDYKTDRLIFRMPRILFSKFKKVQAKNEFAVIETFLVPAVADIINKINSTDSDFYQTYCDKGWFKVLREKYEKEYPDGDIADNHIDAFTVAHSLFKGMINETFDYILKGGRN